MAKDRYFTAFPVITYSNTQCVDITKRIGLLNSISSNPYVYYPYDITVYEREDQFSYRYYDDQYKTWLVYITNKIVDPYYEWYLDDEDFTNFINAKYGDLYTPQQKIKYYINNWFGADSISTNDYDALPAGNKTYFEPVYGYSNKINGYQRRQIDWIVNTNQMVQYTVNSSNGFIKDELCNIVFDNYNSGNGQVVTFSNTNLFIQHTVGFTVANTTVPINSNSYIYGTESQTNVGFSTSQLMIKNLANTEEIYWDPITYYDYEVAKNEYNRSIRVLDSAYSSIAVNDLKRLMKN